MRNIFRKLFTRWLYKDPVSVSDVIKANPRLIDEIHKHKNTTRDMARNIKWPQPPSKDGTQLESLVTDIKLFKQAGVSAYKSVQNLREAIEQTNKLNNKNMKKVCIKGDGTKEYGEKIKKWFTYNGCTSAPSGDLDVCGYFWIKDNGEFGFNFESEGVPEGYTEISLKETRKHIGWTIKKGCEQYLEATDKILKNNPSHGLKTWTKMSYMFGVDCIAEEVLREANVLEAWFTPVYEEELKVGDWWCDYKEQYSSIRNKVFPIVKIDADSVWGKDKVGSSHLSRKRFFEVFRKATPEEIEAAQIRLPQINGYDGEYDKQTGYVKYGCANIDIEPLRNIYGCKHLSDNRDIKSITLDSGVTITMEQIDQILKHVDAQ